MSHWVNQYIGKPWLSGAQGPNAFDCWGFVRWVQREHYQRDVPVVDVNANSLLAVAREFRDRGREGYWGLWREEDVPRDGDAVAMGHHDNMTVHVGVWVDADGGGVAHCQQGCGVILNNQRGLLWPSVRFYRYIGDESDSCINQ